MPNIKSAMKRARANEKKKIANKIKRSELRTTIKKIKASINAGSPDLSQELVTTQQAIDKAAAKGLIHKSKAARMKSRLLKASRAAAQGS